MLTQVYFEGPTPPIPSPSPWFQTKRDANGSAANAPLDIDSLGADYHWRAVLNGDSWLDPFQSAPGFGYLSLLAVAYSKGHDSNGTIGTKAYDMRGARWSMEVRANGLRLGAGVNLYFWMQFRDTRAALGKGRYVNVSYLAQTVDNLLGYTAPFERTSQQTVTSEFKPLVVNFDTTRPADWIHMGAANSNGVNTTDRYEDCPSHVGNLDRIFQHWDWDCGIIAGYGPTMPSAGDYPYGQLQIRKMKLEVDAELNGL